PMAGSSSFGARRGDEPHRPSAWRRRRPDIWRPPPGNSLGEADQGQEDPPQQGDGPADRPTPPQALAGVRVTEGEFGTLGMERAVCRRLPPQKGGGGAPVRTQSGNQDLVAPVDDLSAIRRAYLWCL